MLGSGKLKVRKLIEDYSYSLNDEIGYGYSSRVYKGRNEKSKDIVAVKVIDMKLITNDVEKELL